MGITTENTREEQTGTECRSADSGLRKRELSVLDSGPGLGTRDSAMR